MSSEPDRHQQLALDETRPVFRPVTQPWELNAHLNRTQRYQRIEILAERDGRNCRGCGLTEENIHQALEVHHINGSKSPYLNRLEFCVLMHRSCNQRAERGRQEAQLRANMHLPAPEQVRESATRLSENRPPSSSDENAKARVMRPRWNNWLDKKPFVQINRKKLALKAVHELGIGSSVTYSRYIDEDVEAGILNPFEIEGIPMIRLNPEADTRMLREQKEREA